MEVSTLTIGAVFGFVAKAIVDFFVANAKEDFKDLKLFLAELLKSIEITVDSLNTSVFEHYSKKTEDEKLRRHSILRLVSDFKRLGAQINTLNGALISGTSIDDRFLSELLGFRSASTLAIHSSHEPDFDTLEKLELIHAAYIKLKNKVLILKFLVSTYSLPKHQSYSLKKRVSQLFGDSN